MTIRSDRSKPDFQEFCPEFVLQTFKTQNDARAHDRTRPSQLFASRTEKARNLTVSQRLTPGNPPPRRRPCFPAAVPIWDGDHGDSRVKPANPHTFLCTPCSGPPRRTPFASLHLVMAGQKREARLCTR